MDTFGKNINSNNNIITCDSIKSNINGNCDQMQLIKQNDNKNINENQDNLNRNK